MSTITNQFHHNLTDGMINRYNHITSSLSQINHLVCSINKEKTNLSFLFCFVLLCFSSPFQFISPMLLRDNIFKQCSHVSSTLFNHFLYYIYNCYFYSFSHIFIVFTIHLVTCNHSGESYSSNRFFSLGISLKPKTRVHITA